jgi:7,8-dihydro-6-hydroxymethylpterin-pyrophosphokinase
MAKHSAAYIGLGNRPVDRCEYIKSALKILAEAERLRVEGVSDLRNVAPPAQTAQGEYYAVAKITTTLS